MSEWKRISEEKPPLNVPVLVRIELSRKYRVLTLISLDELQIPYEVWENQDRKLGFRPNAGDRWLIFELAPNLD